MIFADYSPSAAPSLDEQRDALQKGMGRAWMWASSGKLADAPFLEACLQDQRFDQQCEDSRSSWLWDIVQLSGVQARFRDPIYHALCELRDERSANQLCELARYYAQSGDEAFRSRLYEIVESKPISDSPWLGEDEILELDGEDGFLFAARVRGKRLADVEWEWDDGSLAHDAVEKFGLERVIHLLEGSTNEGVVRYHEKWKKQPKYSSTTSESYRDSMRSISVERVIESANTRGENFFRGWGMHADESDLKLIGVELWNADDANVILRLLQVFSNRALPEFDPRLIDLCQHDDEEVQRRAFQALAKNAHPAVRKFALNQLDIQATGPIIRLFAENFESGDEDQILEAINLPEDQCELHWMLMDVIRVLENNPDADCSQLAVMTYYVTPCQNCRFDAAQLLHEQKIAPQWLIEECRYDAEEDCRQLFVEAAIE